MISQALKLAGYSLGRWGERRTCTLAEAMVTALAMEPASEAPAAHTYMAHNEHLEAYTQQLSTLSRAGVLQ